MIIDKINEILLKKKITKTEFYTKTGITKQQMQSWKNGSIPGADKIIIIVNYLRISADELLGTDTNHIAQELDADIKDYYKLKKEYQESIKDMIQMYLDRMEKDKKEDNLSTSKIG